MRTFAYFSVGIFHNAGKADKSLHFPTKAYIPMGFSIMPETTTDGGMMVDKGWQPAMITVGGNAFNTALKCRGVTRY